MFLEYYKLLMEGLSLFSVLTLVRKALNSQGSLSHQWKLHVCPIAQG